MLSRVLASPRLRRVEVAFSGFGVSEYGVWVVILVFAFRRGGTSAAGIVAAVQLLPASVVAPFAARLIDARGAPTTLCGGYLAQALSLGVTAALALSGAPSTVVYAGAVVAACAVTLTRPAQAALLPALVQTPAQLTAANVVTGWVDNLTLLAGPAVASVALATAGPGWALVLFAAVVTGSALAVAPLYRLGQVGLEEEDEPAAGSVGEVVRAAPGALPALVMLTAEYAVLGALDVLEVVLAALVLGLGASGAGYLGAAFGAGGVAGAMVALTLVGRHRLATPLLLAGSAWGAAFIAVGAWPAVGAVLCLLAFAGAGRTVLDVGGRTILHRTVPAPLHGRVFGVLEGVETFGLAVGSLSVPLLVTAAGARGAVAVVGGLLIVVPLLTLPELRRIEAAAPALDAELTLLRGVSLFAMLNAPVLEDLARSLTPVPAPPGQIIAEEGRPGDEYFVVAAGELDVSIAGARVQHLVPGDGFGEIALLHEGVRTATVTATTDVTLFALPRAAFLEAVTGSGQAHRAARELVAERLAMPPVATDGSDV
ncbi:MAG TPA: cyclic nucleotide-binding domain-containing protein [Solirubrobacteraceae bacterium]|nr:cyclic nucleotide-binding domain-containing protein [Solirubrobacteraceae bacterium]